MLATTRMTKSFKMVLLRVLLDNDAVFSGMPIPELAAKCREFLVAHEFLRRDIADAATGQPVEMSPRKWESSWRKFPISIWMQEQEGRSWFAIQRDSLRVAFDCDERLREPLESMSGDLSISGWRPAFDRGRVRPGSWRSQRGVASLASSRLSKTASSSLILAIILRTPALVNPFSPTG